MGTPQGLLLLDKKGRKIDAQLSEVSLNSQIIGLAQDGSGAIHVLTPFALTTIVKQPAGRLAAYTQFSSESLGSITFMLNSIYCNNQRQVLVGANGCYAVIPTNASAEYSTNRKVAFTSLLLDGRDLCQVANKLPAGHAITLEVTNLGYWGRAEYEYRLDGGEWTAALDNRIALGTLLPGRYTLEARLAGVDEGDTEQISFQVGEWWQHWSVKALFYLLLVAMVALVIIKLIKRIRNAKPFHVSATAHEGDAPDAQFLSAIAQAIEQNMKNTGFSVEELARLMNTSRSNLFRRVKKLTGKTPSDLIQELRLQRARQMLEQGGATVAQTAYDVGLNPRQLSSQFKKRYGMSPTQYATGQANK